MLSGTVGSEWRPDQLSLATGTGVTTLMVPMEGGSAILPMRARF